MEKGSTGSNPAGCTDNNYNLCKLTDTAGYEDLNISSSSAPCEITMFNRLIYADNDKFYGFYNAEPRAELTKAKTFHRHSVFIYDNKISLHNVNPFLQKIC